MNRSLWVLREQINEFESQIIIRHEGLNEQAPKIPTTGPVKQYLYKKNEWATYSFFDIFATGYADQL